MSILKRQVHSPLDFVYLFGFMKDNSSVLFSSSNIYFAQKEPIKVKLFEMFECSGQNLSNSLRQFWNGKSFPLQMLYPYLISWKKTPLYFFSSNNIYFAQKEHIKMKVFETSSARVKICEIPHVNFEMTSQFLFKICVILQCHDR